jgi:hypothetical protein
VLVDLALHGGGSHGAFTWWVLVGSWMGRGAHSSYRQQGSDRAWRIVEVQRRKEFRLHASGQKPPCRRGLPHGQRQEHRQAFSDRCGHLVPRMGACSSWRRLSRSSRRPSPESPWSPIGHRLSWATPRSSSRNSSRYFRSARCSASSWTTVDVCVYSTPLPARRLHATGFSAFGRRRSRRERIL